jgi:outer membrane protein
VDSQRILAEAPGTVEAQQTFDRDMQTYQGELTRMETELNTLQENFDRQQGTLTEAVRQQRQQEMQQKFVEYQQRQAQLEQTARDRQAELLSPIMERIQGAIEQLRAEGGYAMILDTSAGVVLSADPQLDLTMQVLDRLRTTSAAPAPAASPATPPATPPAGQ